NTSAHRDLPPSSQSCVHPAITDGAYVASTHPWASKLAGPPTGSNLLRRGGRTPQATQPCTAPLRLTPGTRGQANDRRLKTTRHAVTIANATRSHVMKSPLRFSK